MAHKSSTLNLGSNGHLVINSAMSNFAGTVNIDSTQSSNITGQAMRLNNGMISVQGSNMSMTGSFYPTNKEALLLYDGDNLSLVNSNVMQQIQVQNNSTALVTGFGSFAKPLKIIDNTGVLQLGLQGSLTQNIELNGGSIQLVDSLAIAASASLVGSGTVKLNNHTLTFLGSTLATDNITFSQSGTVAINADLNLQQKLIFSGSGNSYNFVGTGHNINCGGTGGFSVTSDNVLYFNGVYFKNFGASSTCSFFDIDPSATIVLQNSIIDLSSDYTHDSGTLVFKDGCKVIHNSNHFNTTENAFFVIDKAVLVYEGLGRPNNNPFIFTASSNKLKNLRDGLIQSSTDAAFRSTLSNGSFLDIMYAGAITPFDLVRSGTAVDLTITDTGNFVQDPVAFGVNYKLTFANNTPETPKAMSVDWSGQNVYFPSVAGSYLTIQTNVTLTMSNVLFFGYNPAIVSYDAASASLAFGENTNLFLYQDMTVTTSTDRAWNFTGNGEIVGCNTKLLLDGSDCITVTGGSTLKLKNLYLQLKSVDALACLDADSKIILENSTVALESAGWTVSQGNVDISGAVKIIGGSTTTPEQQAKLSFTSTGSWQVCSESSLMLDRGIEFEYKADPTFNGNNLAATKRHFYLQDPSACLELNGATLHSTTTGFALDYGKMIISDLVQLTIDGTGVQDCEIGSGVECIIVPGAILQVDGQLTHKETSFA